MKPRDDMSPIFFFLSALCAYVLVALTHDVTVCAIRKCPEPNEGIACSSNETEDSITQIQLLFVHRRIRFKYIQNASNNQFILLFGAQLCVFFNFLLHSHLHHNQSLCSLLSDFLIVEHVANIELYFRSAIKFCE